MASLKPLARSLAGDEPVVPSSWMIFALPFESLGEEFAAHLPFLNEVGPDERNVIAARLCQRGVDAAIDTEQRDAGVLGLHDGRNQRLLLARGEQNDVDALRDHRADVSHLLGGRAGRVGVDELPAPLRGFVLHALGLSQTPGIVALRLREANLVNVLFLQFGKLGGPSHVGAQAHGGKAARRSGQQRTTCDKHSVFLPKVASTAPAVRTKRALDLFWASIESAALPLAEQSMRQPRRSPDPCRSHAAKI